MLLRLFLALAAATLPAKEQPNILFLLSDDQDWTGLSVPMHPDIPGSKSDICQTPHLEAFAHQSMRFSAAYAPSPVCSSTRISLQTGQHVARLQWTKAAPVFTASAGYQLIPPAHRKSIRAEETTIAEILRKAGYATAHYGKWHISGGGPAEHGYDDGDGDNGNEVAARFKGDNPVDIVGMGKRAAAFMKKSKDSGTPFFIQMSYHALHSPGNARSSSIEKFKELFPDERERMLQRAAITYDLDLGVGQLLKELDALGLTESTWVIYMSDNGAGGRKGARTHTASIQGGKGSLWEGGIRVPLIIRGPGVPADSWCHQRVVGYDLFPTFCELAGINPPPTSIDGGSLCPQLEGKSKPVDRPHEELIFHFPHYQSDTPHSAIFLGDYKLIHFYETNKNRLFNITTDPGERRDLASQDAQRASDLAKLLSRRLTEAKAQLPVANPQAVDGKSYNPREAQGRGSKGGAKHPRR